MLWDEWGPQNVECGKRRCRAASGRIVQSDRVTNPCFHGEGKGAWLVADNLGLSLGAPTFTEGTWASPQKVIVTLNQVNVRS